MNKKRILSISVSFVALLLLIIDGKTASAGATDGIALCTEVIIPSLFPFFLITSYLNVQLAGIRMPGISRLGKYLHFPAGGEYILLLGLIGGYPVGAKMVADAFKRNELDKRTGTILLGYCNNAGPAFIFGIAGALFTNLYAPICLWVIHMISAILTGLLLPHPAPQTMHMTKITPITLPKALQQSISVCASVCGWVIVFKVILAYMNAYLASLLSNNSLIVISGIFELSNGCIRLSEFKSLPIRFILCSGYLAFGGLCVALQTLSITGALKWGLYLPGKLMQTCVSICLSLLSVQILYPDYHIPAKISLSVTGISLCIGAAAKYIAEKSCGNSKCIHV